MKLHEADSSSYILVYLPQKPIKCLDQSGKGNHESENPLYIYKGTKCNGPDHAVQVKFSGLVHKTRWLNSSISDSKYTIEHFALN